MQSRSTSVFVDETIEVMGRVRGAFAAILNAFDPPIQSVPGLRSALKLENKICWRVLKVVQAKDALESALHMHTPAAIKSLIEAAKKNGVSAEIGRAHV